MANLLWKIWNDACLSGCHKLPSPLLVGTVVTNNTSSTITSALSCWKRSLDLQASPTATWRRATLCLIFRASLLGGETDVRASDTLWQSLHVNDQYQLKVVPPAVCSFGPCWLQGLCKTCMYCGDGIHDFGDACRACARHACIVGMASMTVGVASMTVGMAAMSVGMVAGLVQDMHVLWGWHQ